MNLGRQKLARILLSTGIATALLIGVSGLPHFGMSETMDMDGNMTMSDCYMPGMATICNMNPLEHIATWQNAFIGISQEQNVLSLLLLLALVVIAVGIGLIRQQYPPPKNALTFLRRYLDKSHSFPSSPLQELFSSGILNPKLF